MPNDSAESTTNGSSFFERPILNNPYEYPDRHWELDEEGRPTSKVIETRRPAKFITPIPKAKRTRKSTEQPGLGLETGGDDQAYDLQSVINDEAHHCYRSKPGDPDEGKLTGDERKEAPKNYVNWVIGDSSWELELCRVAEANKRVPAYTKNHNLGFEVPYQYQETRRRYLPDFILLIDVGKGLADPLHRVIEVKGYRGEDAKAKADTMKTYWIPGVNNLKTYGLWAFAELTDLWEMDADLAGKIEVELDESVRSAIAGASASAESVEAV